MTKAKRKVVGAQGAKPPTQTQAIEALIRNEEQSEEKRKRVKRKERLRGLRGAVI